VSGSERVAALLEARYGIATEPWERAFVACAQGSFEVALALALPLTASMVDDVRFRARVTAGSAMRQLGRYADARAIELIEDLSEPIQRAHLLISHAADAVGERQLDVARDTLARARSLASHEASSVESRRAHVRSGWVAAEIALSAGDPADALVELASVGPIAKGWPRHVAKTSLFTAVALRELGRRFEARDAVNEAIAIAGPIGAVPIAVIARRILDELAS
jgi:hypothetical protein